MYFLERDLLSFDEITKFLTAEFPNQKAEIIASKLKKYCLIYKNTLYTIDINTIIYSCNPQKKDFKGDIETIATKLIESSILKQPQEKRDLFRQMDNYKKLISNTNSYFSQLVYHLENDKIK